MDKNHALARMIPMYLEETPLFKELMPYSGQIDQNNRWIKLSELVPWERLEVIYLRHFHSEKYAKVKKCRLMMGLLLGQMMLEQSNVQIVEYFHENPYYQYFCGQSTFIPKGKKAIIHHSLLSKRRSRLGKAYMSEFEKEILEVLKEKGLVKGQKLILDATVFPANITYPSDIKLLNVSREYCCDTILKVKNSLDPKRRIRTYRDSAKKVARHFQKTKKKSKAFIRKTRKQMLQYLKRNIRQLEQLLDELDFKIRKGTNTLKEWVISDIKKHLHTAQTIYAQQFEMARTKGRRVANRIVSFKQPKIRPIIRGKEGKNVEFGVKAHVAIVDGFAMLNDCEFDPYHEGIRLSQSLDKHNTRFERNPDLVLADQLYANRDNRDLLKSQGIEHSFRPVGRPPNISDKEKKKQRATFKKHQGERNHIEGLFGTLKSHYHLDKIRWTVPDGESMQIRMGLIASNLNRALAYR